MDWARVQKRAARRRREVRRVSTAGSGVLGCAGAWDGDGGRSANGGPGVRAAGVKVV